MGNAQVMCFCAQMAKQEIPISKSEKPMAIVLGAAVWAGGAASPALRRRAEHAVKLWQDGIVSRIIVSGGIGKHPPSEAQVMADICTAQGVAVSDIVQEDQSTTTEENLVFSGQIANCLGGGSAIIVTDRFHAPRAMLVARRMGLKARADCPSLSGARPHRVVKFWLREIPAFLWYFASGKGRSQSSVR